MQDVVISALIISAQITWEKIFILFLNGICIICGAMLREYLTCEWSSLLPFCIIKSTLQ